MAREKRRLKPGTIVVRVLIVILTTLIMTVIALYLLMLIIAKGPSPSAKKQVLLRFSDKIIIALRFPNDFCTTCRAPSDKTAYF